MSVSAKTSGDRERQILEKALALFTLLVLAAAWAGGMARAQSATAARIGNISPEIVAIRELGDSLYQGQRRGTDGSRPEDVFTIALESHPGYGGPLAVAIVVNGEKVIEHVAVLETSDTRTYIAQIVDKGILNAFLGRDLEHPGRVDAVSGATLSSSAVINGVTRACAAIGAARFGLPLPQRPPPAISNTERIKLALVVLFFAAALFIASAKFPWNKRRAVLFLHIASAIALGFLYGTQFSLAGVSLLLSGAWVRGVASYAPMACLLLAAGIFLVKRKNHYCAMVCPFGGWQECLGAITNGPTPRTAPWMKWLSRFLALAALAFSLYFRNPSIAGYEPFSRTFNFIGSGVLFAASILIVLASLGFRRPWCRLLCPVTPFIDYIAFLRGWGASLLKKGRRVGIAPAPSSAASDSSRARSGGKGKAVATGVLFLLLFALCGMELGAAWRATLEQDASSVAVTRSLMRSTPAQPSPLPAERAPAGDRHSPEGASHAE